MRVDYERSEEKRKEEKSGEKTKREKRKWKKNIEIGKRREKIKRREKRKWDKEEREEMCGDGRIDDKRGEHQKRFKMRRAE